jgi:DNA-binding transcriptional regulator YhcF (GntR family)
MSSRVKTVMPFINKEILCRALTAVGCGYAINGNTITTARKDYTGKQLFELINGRYAFVHETNDKTRYPDRWKRIDTEIMDFLAKVEKEYNAIYRQQTEEERRRLEEERRAFVEKQRQTVIANAKAEGYDVREERLENKIKLVLVRTTY